MDTDGARGRVRVGTCGFGGAQARAFADLDMVEIQQTFYQPPTVRTAEGWRQRAPEGFVFALKAWQLITHRAKSPTYRRLKEPLSEEERGLAGDFRWNPVTRMAWERTRAIALALKAEAVVFQTPKSFRPTEANLKNLRAFFGRIDRAGMWMVFEPRGEDWTDGLFDVLLRELGLVCGIDPFLRRPVGQGPRYFRLHGRPAYHYRYRYTDGELEALCAMSRGAWPVRVLFNNDAMAEDARRFLAMLRA